VDQEPTAIVRIVLTALAKTIDATPVSEQTLPFAILVA
jgi:hypothetical protein